MTIGQENMIRRWQNLSDYEKWGTAPAYTASAILNLMTSLMETGRCLSLTEEQERILLGFEINTGYGAEDGFSFLHCLDLHSVAIDKDFPIIDDLDNYFMEEVKVNGLSFWDRLLPTLR